MCSVTDTRFPDMGTEEKNVAIAPWIRASKQKGSQNKKQKKSTKTKSKSLLQGSEL